MKRKQSLLANLIDGLIAGAVATAALDAVTSWLYEREDEAARDREDEARNGKTAYGVAAEKAAGLFGRQLSKEETDRYGTRIHWALGLSAAALLAALRDRKRDSVLANGLVFGTLFYLLMDEGAVYALGLTPGPTKFPWQTHARGLAGHLAFGAAAGATLRAVQPS